MSRQNSWRRQTLLDDGPAAEGPGSPGSPRAETTTPTGDVSRFSCPVWSGQRGEHECPFPQDAGRLASLVMQLLGKIETSNSDHSSNLKTVQGDQQHELQLLDFKLTSALSDFRNQMQTHQKWTEAQLTRSEEDQAQHRHQLLNVVKERLERAEKRVEEKILLLSLKLEQMDKPQKQEKQLNQMKRDEKKLHARITRFERQIWKELEEIQNEYRSGFQSVHESLELLKQIQNTKLKLEAKKIQRDMKKIQ
nr:PREDICTED: protein FAM81B-like [Phalacrocorax carbo]